MVSKSLPHLTQDFEDVREIESTHLMHLWKRSLFVTGRS